MAGEANKSFAPQSSKRHVGREKKGEKGTKGTKEKGRREKGEEGKEEEKLESTDHEMRR